jgi:hypothetical protein
MEADWASYYSAALFVSGSFIKNSASLVIFFLLFLRCQETGHLNEVCSGNKYLSDAL